MVVLKEKQASIDWLSPKAAVPSFSPSWSQFFRLSIQYWSPDFKMAELRPVSPPLLLWKTVPEHQDKKMQRQTLPLMIQGLRHTEVQHIQKKQTCKFSAPESRPKVPAEKEADLPVEPKKTSKMLKSTAVERCVSQRSILGLLYKQWFSNITEMTMNRRLFSAPDPWDLNLRRWLSILLRIFQEGTWDTLLYRKNWLKRPTVDPHSCQDCILIFVFAFPNSLSTSKPSNSIVKTISYFTLKFWRHCRSS